MLERIKTMILHHRPNPSHKEINQRGRANLSRLRLPALPEEGGIGPGADEGSAPPAAAAGEEEDETGFRG